MVIPIEKVWLIPLLLKTGRGPYSQPEIASFLSWNCRTEISLAMGEVVFDHLQFKGISLRLSSSRQVECFAHCPSFMFWTLLYFFPNPQKPAWFRKWRKVKEGKSEYTERDRTQTSPCCCSVEEPERQSASIRHGSYALAGLDPWKWGCCYVKMVRKSQRETQQSLCEGNAEEVNKATSPLDADATAQAV